MARVIVVAVSIFIAGVGVFGVVAPHRVVGFVSGWQSPAGLWAASVVRLAFGVALWAAAPAAQTPVALKALAAVSVLSALALPVVGVARFEAVLAWWSRRPPAFVRTWCAVAAAVGLFVLGSVLA